MNTYVLDENMVNWINNTRAEFAKVAEESSVKAAEVLGHTEILDTEEMADFSDYISEQIMEWPTEKKIELGRVIWTQIFISGTATPNHFRFIHNLIKLEVVSLFFNSIE